MKLPDCLKQAIHEYKEVRKESGLDWEEETGGIGGAQIDRLSPFWPYGEKKTRKVVLAKIPEACPWEVLAWLPMGDWNERPDASEMIAAARYWFLRNRTIPAAVSRDELEFYLDAPAPDPEQALALAVE